MTTQLANGKQEHGMKKTLFPIITALLILLPVAMQAQVDSSNFQKTYQEFKEQAFQDYDEFRAKAYDEFERFLSEAWTEYQSFAGPSDAYTSRKPETVPSLSVSTGIIDCNAPFIESEMQPTETESERKDALIPSDGNESNIIMINFYNRALEFHVPKSLRITAKGTKESQVAKYHETMRENDVNHSLQKELDDAVNQMGLNDWGYFTLLRSISEKAFSETNDRVLFCFYMLHSHGFKARVGRGQKSGQILLLLALDNSKEVYSLTFFRINGTKYYIVYGNGKKGENAYSYNEKADDSNLKEIGLDFKNRLHITDCDKTRKLHLNKVDLDIELPYSTAHLRYYDGIPTTEFPIYSNTAVSIETEQTLASTFHSLGKTYNKVQLVDIMLNFVQTAFAYKIDELQFDREKYFFPEETIGLPYSDCEDRSALFAWMVRRFTGYEVIGILYPDHLATAVCFGDGVQLPGKSLTVDGKHYVICDPTYANASIGTVMPKYADATYEIVKMN